MMVMAIITEGVYSPFQETDGRTRDPLLACNRLRLVEPYHAPSKSLDDFNLMMTTSIAELIQHLQYELTLIPHVV